MSCKFLGLMRGLLLAFALFASGSAMAQAPEGIPRELARQRASQISDVRYHLRFTLTPHAPTASGHEELQFHANSSGDVLLDFREGTVAPSLSVNLMADWACGSGEYREWAPQVACERDSRWRKHRDHGFHCAGGDGRKSDNAI